MSQSFLITGATGKQGGAVIKALLAHPKFSASNSKIYAVTRNPSSPSAAALAAKSPSIKLISGDLNNPTAMFKSIAAPVWGVFSVQLPGSKEVQQGNGLIDAAVANNVKHFVYTSVDRHGDASKDNPTDVPHFITKHAIEKHLMEKAAASNGEMTYTILRPVFFVDNITNDMIGKVIATAWRNAVDNKKLQVIATTDVGFFGAAAFLEPETYRNKAISLAGDELTFEEADAIFQKITGKPIPTTFGILPWMVLASMKEMGNMFKFFRTVGFGADLGELRKINPGLKTFEQYVEGSSFAKKM
ncbi:hypothetical protein MMC24_006412 [Lignoscripta atroalba]|nr:hypothetical protein [Lignoscripta atroalba]